MATEAGRPRAPYAANPAASRGRYHAEAASATRNAFRRDCDRIIHAGAFRRLKYKTQVFIYNEGDFYRTRLTHTLEVMQIARALARALGLDEDLAEALALAHDLGHPPFGHSGERALDDCLRAAGGFDHNAQSLRVVTVLERRYPSFDGLNLSWETLEGIVKHNGPLTDRSSRPVGHLADGAVPPFIAEYTARHDLELSTHAGAEAQVAAIADDIAYNAHDLDDGLRAGLFTLDDLASVPLFGALMRDIDQAHPKLDGDRRAAELIRRLIGRMIEGVIAESDRRIAALAPRSSDDIRASEHPVIGLDPDLHACEQSIKSFLFARMYRHGRIMRIMTEAERTVRELFAHYVDSPADLPADWHEDFRKRDAIGRLRLVGDFIAGMTDRFALAEHARHFDSTPDLR